MVVLNTAGGEGMDWTQPLDPAYVGGAWTTVLNPGMLPYSDNPASGYVQACGNPPWLAVQDNDADADRIPVWLPRDHDSFRAFRMRDVLSRGTFSFSDMEHLVFDRFVPAAAELIPALAEMAKAQPERVANAHPDLAEGIQLLNEWDLVADVSSRAMTFFHVMWSLLQTRIPNFGDSTEVYLSGLRSQDPQALALLWNAAADAARMLRNSFPDFSPPWGQVHRVVRGDADAASPGSLTGGAVWASGDAVTTPSGWPVGYGPGFAMAVEFGDTPRARSIVPFGASSRPDSPISVTRWN